jgi:AraC-like DNA-binding protein
VADASVAAGFPRALIDLAVSKGADRDALIARSGIDPARLENQDDRIPFAQYVALMHAGQDLTGDPALALHFGEAFEIAELSIVGLMGQACATIAETFELMDRYTRLVIDVPLDEEADGKRCRLSRIGGKLWLVDTRKDPNDFPELTESAFARAVCAARAFPGGDGLVREVHFTHEAPPYRAEYDRIFRVPIKFGSERNALLMKDLSWMNLKGPLPSRYVFEILTARAENLLGDLEKVATTRGRVEALLVPILHEGGASMAAVARRMAISRPTLFRRLKAEGATFEKVLDELRRKLALEHFGAGKASVNETAYLVGFSDPAAFSRAFKRWTGASPRAMRAAGGRAA